MSKVIVNGFSLSRDGFGAGPDQDEANPLGRGGRALHEWIFATASGRRMIGESGGSEGVDDRFFSRDEWTIGATVMGRNMFSPRRGPWGDPEWRGWWGETPPFGHPVFVLTHFAREPLVMDGTTFYFVGDGLDAALDRARDAAGDADIAVGGGVATLRACLAARLVDEVRLAVVPVDLGAGERLVASAGAWPAGYEVSSVTPGEGATHYVLARTAGDEV